MDKGQYDGYRQGVNADASAIVGKHDAYRNAGQLDAQALEYFINELDTLMASFKATTDENRRQGSGFYRGGGTIEASWLDPRFHDYYDFFTTISDGWKRDLAAIPPPAPISVAPAYQMPPEEPQASGWTIPGVTPPPAATPSVPVFLQPPPLLPGIEPAPPPETVFTGPQGPFGGWIGDAGGSLSDTISQLSPVALLAIGVTLYLLLRRRA